MSTEEADRLIALAVRDAREPAPAGLRDRLARRHLPRRRARWIVPAMSALAGAAVAAIVLIIVRPAAPADDNVIAREAIGDHQRMLGHPLGVETNDLHNVKPWFAGKLDFVPPVTFLGDADFPLRGGDVAIFDGHKAAAFAYTRRLHHISLFVFEHAGDAPHVEITRQGFHAITWSRAGFGFALVSDVAWDDLRSLAHLLD